jgi:hypothetical protein
LGMLHAIRAPYQVKNEMVSTLATWIEYHANPMVLAHNMAGEQLRVGPGQVVHLSGDQSLEAFRAEPNVPMAQALMSLLQEGIEDATYGREMDPSASGFAINSRSQQARSRVNIIRGNIESAASNELRLVFGLIEAFSPDEGVTVYGKSERSDRGKPLKLNKRIIKGNYANKVILVPEQPIDDNAKIMAWLQMVEKNVVSMSLMRNRAVNVPMPRDEETRIAAERALKSPQMQLKTDMRALQATYPEKEWEQLFIGTEYEQLYLQEKEYREQKAAEEAASKERKQMEKMTANLQSMLASMPPPMPPGMMGDPMQMPPGLEGMGGPMSMGGGSMPPEMMPPGTGAMPGLPSDPSMQPPGLPGMPPEMTGMTPDMLGLGGNAMPGQFQDMMQQAPPSDEEMMRRMGGLPPQM